jgi:hypothetical protein
MTTTQTTETDTYQDLNENVLQRVSLTLHWDGTAEMLIETRHEPKADVEYALVGMNKEQMWEHIHNCLTIMEGMK